MTIRITQKPETQQFFREAAGLENTGGSDRSKAIMLRILQETARIIEDLQITDGAADQPTARRRHE